MNLMLAVVFASILVGLLSPRIGQRQLVAITVLSIMMTLLYYVFPGRLL